MLRGPGPCKDLPPKNPLNLDFGPFGAPADGSDRRRKRHGDNLLERFMHGSGGAVLVFETRGA